MTLPPVQSTAVSPSSGATATVTANRANSPSTSTSSDQQHSQHHVVQDKKKVNRYDAVLCEELFAESQRRKAMWIDVCRLVMGAIVTFGALDAKNTTQRLHQARAAMSEGVGTPNVTRGSRY